MNNHISYFGYASVEMEHVPEAGKLCRVGIL